jgi:uncharacterized protein (TIGR03435 family)
MKRTMMVGFMIFLANVLPMRFAHAQTSFAVATIRPSSEAVQFEHDGRTEVAPGLLQMHDVTVATCVKWAYGVQDSQISGSGWLQADHFDIMAKADGPATEEQMKLMLRTLLADRFKLSFHRVSKELKSFAMTATKGSEKLQRSSSQDGKSAIQNSAIGSVVKSTTMQEWANFIAGPLQTPVVDMTGLPGRYDFAIDFTPYLPTDMATMRPDATSVIMTAMQGELGLKLEARKEQVEVMVVDHVEQPSAN